ncbi:hypothetical protein BGZ68_008951 [Mortierella alpina]|nr:hypothetical protein BGZ68_008951 [Mortierella alpina]
MNTSASTKNTNQNRKRKAKKNTNAGKKEIDKSTINATDKANTSIGNPTEATNESTDAHKQMVDDLTEAVPSNHMGCEHTPTPADIYAMSTEHAELYKKLVRNLAETVPTNDEAIETARCRTLFADYEGDLMARRRAHRAHDPWGRTKTIKKSDDAVIDQLLADILHFLENILRNATEPVSVVFYNTMKGRYYHYMAEYLTDHDKRLKVMYQDQALSAFLTAKESAASSAMSVIDPFYLELHISLAKCYYLMGMYRTARLTNIWAYHASRKCEDHRLDEVERKLSAEIMERMRNLMNSWTDAVFDGITY